MPAHTQTETAGTATQAPTTDRPAEPRPDKKKSDGLAADAAVRRLLERIGIADGPRDKDDHALAVVTADAQRPKVDENAVDAETEALTPHEMAAFEQKLASATDQTLADAVKQAGGIVAFMKAMAAGKTIGGVDEAKFEQMWNNSVDESWLKDKFRAADPSMHEWIPSNQIEEVVQKAKSSKQGGTWVDLQNELRSPTMDVLFDPAKVNKVSPDGHQLMQGHVGALYVNGVMQTEQEAAFHDELRAAFAASNDIASCVDGLKAVMERWMWKGEALPKPFPPGLEDSMNKPIDEKALIAGRAAKFKTMESLFDQMRAKFGGAAGTKK